MLPTEAYGSMVTPWQWFTDSDNFARHELIADSAKIVTGMSKYNRKLLFGGIQSRLGPWVFQGEDRRHHHDFESNLIPIDQE